MTAIKKDELERLEAEHGLSPDGLSYQHRCSRITAAIKGEEWTPPQKKRTQRRAMPEAKKPAQVSVMNSPLYGKKLLITPMMRPDAKRNLAYDEVIGPEVIVEEFSAGESIYNQPESVRQMSGDYVIKGINRNKQVIAQTTFPKIGTEISFTIGRDLVPVVRGNDGKTGYIWSFPTMLVQLGDTVIQLQGLKTLITQMYPELLPRFSGKPVMDYVDGVTLVASIPFTRSILAEHSRQKQIDAKAGINV